MAQATPEVLHGSAVAVDGRAVLIVGKPGSGKSSLALELISRGGVLVADDRVIATPGDAVRLTAPDTLAGLIEARGVGLLTAPHAPAHLALVVDMDRTETARLPEPHETVIAGARVPSIAKVESAAFPAMVLAYLRGGRRE
ncbi:MAG: serine kinase [Pseudomonadota bacterium]